MWDVVKVAAGAAVSWLAHPLALWSSLRSALSCRASRRSGEVELSASGALLAGPMARNPLHLVTEHCAGRRPTEVGALGIPVSPLAKGHIGSAHRFR